MARPRKDNDNSKPKKVKPFAAWLDAGLSKQGKSNTRLAEILGISQSRVSEMRNGKRDSPRPQCAPELAAAPGLNLTYLLDGKGQLLLVVPDNLACCL